MKLTLTDLTNLTGSTAVNTINNNNLLIETALENTLSLDGTSPNALNTDLDMNNNQIINLPEPVDPTDVVRVVDIEDLVTPIFVNITQGPVGPEGPDGPVGPEGPTGPSNVPRGDYSAIVQYVTSDLVTYQSSSWIALQDTIGNAPPTLPTTSNAYWMLNAAVGPSGPGTGDVTGQVSSIDDEIALFNGTSGKNLKRATTTGLLKAASGVIAAATAGTDYIAPGSGTATSSVSDASDSAAGKVELATAAETSTGTDATRAVTPDGLAGSTYGKAVITVMAYDGTQDVETGDGAGGTFYRIPSTISGFDLVEVAASVYQAGTTGTVTIQVNNSRTGDMLSTRITIDSAETDSSTAATPAVINGATDDIATGDRIRIDVDTTTSTAPLGLIVELTFQKP